MRLTKISPQVKNKNRFNIFIDEDYFCSVSANDLLKLKIVLEEIDQDRAEEIKQAGSQSLLKAKILNYIAVRPRSIFEVKKYISEKIYKSEELNNLSKTEKAVLTDTLINQIEKLGYLSDQKFADWFIEQRITSPKPKSIRAIKAELSAKGVPRDITEIAISSLNEQSDIEESNAQKSAEKKFKTLKNKDLTKQKLRQKLTFYLQSKGFAWDSIKSAVDSLI